MSDAAPACTTPIEVRAERQSKKIQEHEKLEKLVNQLGDNLPHLQALLGKM